MPLPLPPKSIIRLDQQTAKSVHDQLTSVIAGHAFATTTYRFYEEIDHWLGPWGQNGYPIEYGKFYNIAFTSNEKLQANPITKKWVWQTTIILQEVLRDYIVARIRNGTLPSLTEAELCKAAFDSHPQAYDKGGLAMVALTAPELIPIVALIPSAEYLPTDPDFWPTIKQLRDTLRRVAPQVAGGVLAATAGPAHTGLISRAVQQDRRRFLNELSISQELGNVKSAIMRGDLDHIVWLDQIIASLSTRQFPDQGYARFAQEVIQAAQIRRSKLEQYYDRLLEQSPGVKKKFKQMFPRRPRP